MSLAKLASAAALLIAVSSVPAMAHDHGDRRGANHRVLGMDRDGNGIITQNEWTGTVAAFNRLDLNHDGVLSGNELRDRRADHRQNDRLRGLDRNGNGVISRDEFPGNDRAFLNLDRDRNGVLTANELRREHRVRKDDDDEDDDHDHHGRDHRHHRDRDDN